MYTSYHDEVGMYVTGDYTKDNLILQAVMSRSLIIDDYYCYAQYSYQTIPIVIILLRIF